jgi:PAS domain S-box-containing protein
MTPDHFNTITVLFVDDEEENLKAYRTNFRRDLNVLTAMSAHSAFDILEFEKVDVIVSDQRMPDKTGVEFLAEAKAKYPEIQRIIVTGYSDIEAVVGAINKAQVFNYLTKPFTPEELLAQIKKAHRLNVAELERDIFSKRSEHMFRVSQNAVILFDELGSILDVNPAMESLSGYEKSEIKHIGMADIMIDAEKMFLQAESATIDSRPQPFILKKRDGGIANCQIVVEHIAEDHKARKQYQAIILEYNSNAQRRTA